VIPLLMVLVVLVVVVADSFRARGGGPARSHVGLSTVAWFGPKPRATRTPVGNVRVAESKGPLVKPEIVEECSAKDKTR
jgi:hypothetical protein